MPLRHSRLSRHAAGAQAVKPDETAASKEDLRPAMQLAWRAEALWRQLDPYLPGLSVEVLDRAESTNTLLLERARAGGGRRDAPVTTPGELAAMRSRGRGVDEPGNDAGPFGRRAGDTQPALLVAEHQTHGRGRQGRAWKASAGASLTFSLSLPLEPRNWSGLSLAVGVALANALDPPEPGRTPRLQLKWPNDLWLVDTAGASTAGRKLGGVLIETVAVGRQRMVVVGVGLNITALAADPLREMSSGFACLQEISPAASAPDALQSVALPLVKALRQFEREGFAGFATAYARRDLLQGRRVTVLNPGPGGTPLEGEVEGVSSDGALLLRVGASLHPITSGEVSVRMMARGSATP
jgi:BirA family transcriptional regulator, biotin operon repressor / biotin---[acetyl-CoA-carboxylase] ligase